MLSLIEQDHMDGGPNRMLRLKNLFMEDKSIIQEMIMGRMWRKSASLPRCCTTPPLSPNRTAAR